MSDDDDVPADHAVVMVPVLVPLRPKGDRSPFKLRLERDAFEVCEKLGVPVAISYPPVLLETRRMRATLKRGGR